MSTKTEYKYLSGYQKFIRDYFEKLNKDFKGEELTKKRKTAMKDAGASWKAEKSAGTLAKKYLEKAEAKPEAMKKAEKEKKEKKKANKKVSKKLVDEKDKKIAELEKMLADLKIKK